jgi:penicillin-insensitive murein endopeptidase
VVDGFIAQSHRLPQEGPNASVFPDYRVRGTNWGTDELVDFVERAAAAVAERHPGSMLQVANLARNGGGSLPWSISHKAGRDVDLGFYMLDDQGAQVLLPAMVELEPPLGETTTSDGRRCRFDPARNWILVSSMLSDPTVTVQYIFVADFLIRRMFEHAMAGGESRRDLDKLKPLLRQPRGTKSHNDHYHVRIACSPDDRLEGCRDIVAGAEIVPVDDPAWQGRVAELLRIIDDDPDPDRRAAAASRLGLLKAGGAAPALLRFLRKCEDPHCLAGLQAIAALGRRPPPDLLVDVVKRSSDLDAVRSAFRLLRRQKPGVTELLVPLLTDQRVLAAQRGPYTAQLVIRREACLAIGWIGTIEAGDHVAPLLADLDPTVRAASLWALRALAASEVFADAVIEAPPADPAGAWKAWRGSHKDPARNLVESMKALGYPLQRKRPDPAEARHFLKAILEADHISLNAQRTLGSLTKRGISVRLDDKADPHWLWNRELSRLKRNGRGKR